jgi:hypothetical protein
LFLVCVQTDDITPFVAPLPSNGDRANHRTEILWAINAYEVIDADLDCGSFVRHFDQELLECRPQSCGDSIDSRIERVLSSLGERDKQVLDVLTLVSCQIQVATRFSEKRCAETQAQSCSSPFIGLLLQRLERQNEVNIIDSARLPGPTQFRVVSTCCPGKDDALCSECLPDGFWSLRALLSATPDPQLAEIHDGGPLPRSLAVGGAREICDGFLLGAHLSAKKASKSRTWNRDNLVGENRSDPCLVQAFRLLPPCHLDLTVHPLIGPGHESLDR